MFTVSNKDTRTMLITVNFEHVPQLSPVSLLLTLNKKLLGIWSKFFHDGPPSVIKRSLKLTKTLSQYMFQ